MQAQRKRIFHARVVQNVTEIATIVGVTTFDADNAVNVHGVNISIGMSPFGPDETLVGRWYVLMLPRSVNNDAALRAAWIANLNTIALANTHLNGTDMVWGAGSIVCAEQSTFQHTFSPKTSRNMQNGSALVIVVVADAVSGVIDDWDAATTTSLFTS